MLNIDNLHKSFADNHVLHGINLTIDTGSMVTIIGPNGCGKSTLLNVITADLRADAGTVNLDGDDLTNLKPYQIAQRGVLLKYQIPAVFSKMSVEQHLQLPFIIQNKAINTTVIQQTASEMGLASLLTTPTKNLSAGQKQWLELAMLVLFTPRILLLDEPISGMTVAEIQTTLTLLKKLNDKGLTILVIEHNMSFVRDLTDDIVVIIDGKVHIRDTYANIEQDEVVRERYLGNMYV